MPNISENIARLFTAYETQLYILVFADDAVIFAYIPKVYSLYLMTLKIIVTVSRGFKTYYQTKKPEKNNIRKWKT